MIELSLDWKIVVSHNHILHAYLIPNLLIILNLQNLHFYPKIGRLLIQ